LSEVHLTLSTYKTFLNHYTAAFTGLAAVIESKRIQKAEGKLRPSASDCVMPVIAESDLGTRLC